MWNERYQEEELAYGDQPNDFLVAALEKISVMGKALCLAEGQGRNAIYLAGKGMDVTAVDLSDVGLSRAEKLAASRGVSIKTEVADLSHWPLKEDSWDLIVSIWAHMPPNVRQNLHLEVVKGLKPGGYFVLEAYTPDNVGRGVGGPPDAQLTMTLDSLRTELKGLECIEGQEIERMVKEGRYHDGKSAVVQLIMKKP